jgi:O-acetyl-ADP-ribose deacetylase (regulator of RNase III)
MGHLFVIHGDITQLVTDAIVYSTRRALDGSGDLYSAFAAQVPGFEAALKQLRELRPDLEVGQSVWVMHPSSQPTGVLAAISVGGAQDKLERSSRVVQSALRTAVTGLREAGRKGFIQIALPTFLAGKGGGKSQLLGLARAQLEAAQAVLAEPGMEEVDAIFVAYTKAIFHTYLAARRGLGQVAHGLPPPPAELVQALRDRDCVLFVGSGLSLPAGLGSWSGLIADLQARLGLSADAVPDTVEGYLDLAQWYRDAFAHDGHEGLDQVVGRHFDRPDAQLRPTLAHYLLFSLHPKTVITTNYDRLLEKTGQVLRRPVTRVVAQKDVPLAGRGEGTCVVKLHGDVRTPGSIVLSRDDYDHFFQKRPALTLLLEGLLLTQTFFFVGYSLRDPDFRQIHSRIALMLEEAKRPAFASTFDAHGPHAQAQWQKKQLELVGLPSEGDRARTLALWLDALADRVLDQPPILLAADSDDEVPEALLEVRSRLLEAAFEVERLCRPNLLPDEARHLARVLDALVALGWQPRGPFPMWRLWHDLALSLPEPAEQRALLRRALTHTERLSDVEMLETLLGMIK